MFISSNKSFPFACTVFLAIICLESAPVSGAGRYSPDHPTVVAMVDRAAAFLERTADHKSPPGSMMTGGDILVGYTVLLAKGDPAHPKVQRAGELAAEVIRAAANGEKSDHIVYTVSVSVVLLATLNPERYRPELEAARDWYVKIQRSFGGFGYLSGQYPNTGDTSQVQYVVLAFWALNKAGISIPVATVENTINFLVATQDPSGAWGYQGIVARGGALVPQNGVSKSLGTAGIGALLMASDILRLLGDRKFDSDEIPSVFERIDNRPDGKREGRSSLRLGDLQPTISEAFNYQDESPPQGPQWYYYWRYAQERYETFREIMDPKHAAQSDWYDSAVEEFAATQEKDGTWKQGQGSGSKIDTSFVVLFLIRSTKRSLGTLDEGLAFGGYELPSDVSSVRMVGDRLVSDAETSVENLIELMEGENQRISESMLQRDMQLSDDSETRSAQVDRLRRLLTSRNPTARRLAARLLGRSDRLEVAPDLIVALTDPDPYVPHFAEEGLRLISRKLNSVHLKIDATAEEKLTAERFWKDWYLGLLPEHVFTDR
jgi:hypothetical protein